MSTYRTTGLVLSSYDFREADKIFSIYTATHGKIEARATGVRKIQSKLRAHLEPFSVIDLTLAHGRRYDRIISAILQKNYSKIKSNYDLLIVNYQLLEIIDQLTKLHHPDIRIFNLAKEVFDFLQSQEVDSGKLNSLEVYFTLNFLSLLGYAPELKICVRCKSPISNPSHFSFKDGSVICGKCALGSDQQISSGSINILNTYLNKYFFSCEKNIINDECRKVVKNFLAYHLDRPLKSEIFIK